MVEYLAAVDPVDGIRKLAVSGRCEFALAIYNQGKCNIRIGQDQLLYETAGVGCFSRRRLQKLCAGRCVVKEIPDHDCRSVRCADLLKYLLPASFNYITGGGQVTAALRHEFNFCDRADAGECLTPEAQGSKRAQILRFRDFACGMTQESKGDIFFRYSSPIVRDAQHPDPAVSKFDRDTGTAGVDGIFNQFLCHRSRTFHRFACCYAVNCFLVQHMNPVHHSLRVNKSQSLLSKLYCSQHECSIPHDINPTPFEFVGNPTPIGKGAL